MSTDSLTQEQEIQRLKAELQAETERADAAFDVIASQSERIFILSNRVRVAEAEIERQADLLEDAASDRQVLDAAVGQLRRVRKARA